AEFLDQPETLAQALNTKSTLLSSHLHRPREAQILLEGALEIALEHDLHGAALRAYNNLGTQLWVEGRWQPFLRNVDRALEAARRFGDRRWESQFLAGPVGTLVMLGRWEEALTRAAEAEEFATTEFVRGMLLLLAPIHLHRGEFDRVRDLLATSEGMARSENAGWIALYGLTESLPHAAAGTRHRVRARRRRPAVRRVGDAVLRRRDAPRARLAPARSRPRRRGASAARAGGRDVRGASRRPLARPRRSGRVEGTCAQ